MTYIKPQDDIINGNLTRSATQNAIFDALELKADLSYIDTLVPSQTGNTGKFLYTNGTTTSWEDITFPPEGANKTLSNLTAPTAINQDLLFNKTNEAILAGSDAKATQANHNLTIRAGNSGSLVNGGDLTLLAGASTGGNTGSIYLRLDGGTRIASQGIYFVGNDSNNLLEINNGGTISYKNILFSPDNTHNFGASGAGPSNIHNRPRYIFTGTGFYGPWDATGFLSGGERIYDNAAPSGNLEVRGGDGSAGSSLRATNNAGFLTLRGGNHPADNATNAGAITIQGGNKTAGTGNGGNVTISGGTSVGGTAGSIVINTSGVERLRIKNATEMVVNETGVDYDFRVEGQTDENLVFVDASTNRVGIGTSSPNSKVQINNSGTQMGLAVFSTSSNNTAEFYNQGTTNYTLALNSAANSAQTGASIGGYFARGTLGSRQQTLANDVLLSITASGHTGSAVAPSVSAGLIIAADQDTTAGGFGGQVSIVTTPNDTLGLPLPRLTVKNDGNVGIGTSTPTQKLDVNGGLKFAGGLIVKSLHAQAGTADVITVAVSDYYVGVDCSLAAKTVNLPAAATAGAGKTYVIKDETGNAATNNITIDADGAELIDGVATYVILIDRESVTLVCDGTNWQII
jgi:hypothetical protein